MMASGSQVRPSLDGLLTEIQSCTGSESMNSVLLANAPTGCLALPGLDQAQICLESSQQLSGLLRVSRGDVIEVTGGAGCGKTELLYQFASQCVSPCWLDSKLSRGGWGKSVLVLDCDSRWNVYRLREHIKCQLQSIPNLPSETSNEFTALLDKCLDCVHLFRPASFRSLACSLVAIRAYHQSHMQSEQIGLILIDSLSAFHWQDRFAVERFRTPSQLLLVSSSLQDVIAMFSPVVVATTWNNLSIVRNPGGRILYQDGEKTEAIDTAPSQALQHFPAILSIRAIADNHSNDTIASIFSYQIVLHSQTYALVSKGFPVSA